MSRIRPLVALGVIAALAVILWAFYDTQAHPLGSLRDSYLMEFPSLLLSIGITAVLVLVAIAWRRRRRNP
ncbi:MAG TPA: hypothetical protein VMW11_00730 [Candidatus Dormibacteraeota bacterium]|nr:hypothetical protein [Candidatus Dormibacteraeota bacterium]